VHAVPVALPGADSRQEAVPDVAVGLGDVQPLLVPAGVVVEAELDALGHLGEEREVSADAVITGTKGVRLSRPYFVFHPTHLPQLLEFAH
jgi:hypothetical protein